MKYIYQIRFIETIRANALRGSNNVMWLVYRLIFARFLLNFAATDFGKASVKYLWVNLFLFFLNFLLIVAAICRLTWPFTFTLGKTIFLTLHKFSFETIVKHFIYSIWSVVYFWLSSFPLHCNILNYCLMAFGKTKQKETNSNNKQQTKIIEKKSLSKLLQRKKQHNNIKINRSHF